MYRTWRMVMQLLIIMSLVYSSGRTAEAGLEQHTIATRSGVTVDFIIMTPEQQPSDDAIIVFTGGNGAVPFRLTDNGAVTGWNFLIRSADDFTRRGLTVVASMPPSDHHTGITSDFRESQEHAQDMAHVADYLTARGIKNIYLAGNSRGTLSVASLGSKLRDSHVKGIILTSTLDSDFLLWSPADRVRKPVLMIHHRDDGCRVSPFQEALKTVELMRQFTSVNFVEVTGNSFFQMSEPCNDLSSHGFFGSEEKVVQVIADWIKGRRIPARIE